MARLQLEFPDAIFCYETHLTVRVTDINYANHLGNDSLISLLSEVRARFLLAHGMPEEGLDGIAVIVTDLATVYQGEARARDELRFEVGLDDINRYGGDVVFRVTRPADGAAIALAKTGFVFFDYRTSKVAPMPEAFRARFN